MVGIALFAQPVGERIAGSPPPSAKELWQAYPLQPKATAGHPAGAVKPGAARPRPPHEATRAAGGGIPTLVVIVAGGVAGALGVLGLWSISGRRRPASEPSLEPAAGGAEPLPPHSRAGPLFAKPTNGHEQPPDSTSEAQGRPAGGKPPDVERRWTAEIGWAAGDDRSRFRAVAQREDEGEEAVVAESPSLSWPPRDASAVRAMSDAVADIEHGMLAAGWAAIEPGTVWYAKRFAWTPAGETTAEPAAGAAEGPGRVGDYVEPEPTEQLWRCEIAWDARHLRSRFVAVARAPGGKRARPIASSAPFRWRFKADPDPRAPEHEAAVRGLVAALMAAGWERAGLGVNWYSKRFVWRRADPPPDHLEPIPTEAPDAGAAPWFCEITWTGRFPRPRFQAVAHAPGDRRGRRIGSSTPFRFDADPDPRAPEHEAAVRSLEAALVAAGWEPAGVGMHWYAKRFVWRHGHPPPDHVEPIRTEAGDPVRGGGSV